jgi:hypothetical protein
MSRKSETDRFRKLIRHIAHDPVFGPDGTLFTFAYWLNDRKAAPSFVGHVKALGRFAAQYPDNIYSEEHRGEWPELYRYTSGGLTDKERTELERVEAGMFCDGFLSRPEHPAGEGWVYVRMLTRWAYTVSAGDRLTALEKKGKLFTRGFSPIVTMDDMPDYPTMKPWDGKALADMNAYAVWIEGPAAAWDAYKLKRFTEWYPAYERAGVHPDRPVRTVDAVHVILGMAEQGMKDGVRLLRDDLDHGGRWDTTKVRYVRNMRYGELEPVSETVELLDDMDGTARRRSIIADTLAGGDPDSVEDYSPYFTPVTGGDPYDAYLEYLDRLDMEQEGKR